MISSGLNRTQAFPCFSRSIVVAACVIAACGVRGADPARQAAALLEKSGVRGGIIVEVGATDPAFTAALRADPAYVVQALCSDRSTLQELRTALQEQGLYGPVSVDLLSEGRLPYIENLVNLIVLHDPSLVEESQWKRVLRPGGVAALHKGSSWSFWTKPWPAEIDQWTHYLHDPSNNAVSHDKKVAPPKRLQWIAAPRYSRHHDRMSSVNAVVSAGGRVFSIEDEGSRISILLPPKWTLVARDAFNGVVLWKRRLRNWHMHLWPLKSGPAQLPRRLVALGDRVYVTLALDDPISVLDAATGATIRAFPQTKATEEILATGELVLALVNPQLPPPPFADPAKLKTAYGGKWWDEKPRKITAIQPETGQTLWQVETRILPGTLAFSSGRVVFHDGERVVCLDGRTGEVLWRSEPVPRCRIIRSFYLPTLVVYRDIVLFSGGETAGNQTGSWYMGGTDTMTALSLESGKKLWKAYHPPSGYRSPEDLFVANGLVWTGETTSGRAIGVFTGRDPYTGEVKCEFPPDVKTYWFHHRCYRGKATDYYLLVARAGTEFIDTRTHHWTPNYWFRGACLYGVMPANGLVYAPPHPCACYLETKQSGFNALAPGGRDARKLRELTNGERLEKGPAYGQVSEAEQDPGLWPTYRHDAARSGKASCEVPGGDLSVKWRKRLEGRLTSPVVAYGKVFVAEVDKHTLYALDCDKGEIQWKYTAGGPIDSPPTVYRGRVYFGCRDGRVYCLRAEDGRLVWRFLAAPFDERLSSFGRIESVWPVSGSVLIYEENLYFVAGRSAFLDGGLWFWRLDPISGEVRSVQILNEKDPDTGKDLQAYVSWLNMPVGLPDILSCDGKYIYMRSQPFSLKGKRLPLQPIPRGRDADAGAPPPVQNPKFVHLFCPTGFLDDAGWHRSYWLYGSSFVSGWCGYFLAGRVTPAGKILAVDEKIVYGFGRKPKYYRWTTPLEHQLFAAHKTVWSGQTKEQAKPSFLSVEKSPSLNPQKTPITISAWVKAQGAGGVILAHGGEAHGYALYLKRRQPAFAVRTSGKLTEIVSTRRLPKGRWVHLAAVLDQGGRMTLYVDGQKVAAGKAPGLLAANPAEGMQLGCDDRTTVGGYRSPSAFSGALDEIRIYHRALDAEEIGLLYKAPAEGGPRGGLVLWYTFDKGNARDFSGNKNNGKLQGASFVRGVSGKAVRFTGRGPGSQTRYFVEHLWTKDLPIFVRALVLAGDRLFAAGPPDVMDEEEVFRRIGDPSILVTLRKQDLAYQGKLGALLLAVSTEDGTETTNLRLPAPPVFDGMAAAYSKLFISLTDGSLVCVGSTSR